MVVGSPVWFGFGVLVWSLGLLVDLLRVMLFKSGSSPSTEAEG